MRILGIETSCDDTGIGIYDAEQGLIAHTLFSQTKLHEQFGGTVPELASREHANRINELINITLEKADTKKNQITAIAYTKGPGLAGALLVGASTAKAMGFALGIPTIGIHHLEGHILAALLAKKALNSNKNILDIVKDEKLFTSDELDSIFNVKKLTGKNNQNK